MADLRRSDRVKKAPRKFSISPPPKLKQQVQQKDVDKPRKSDSAKAVPQAATHSKPTTTKAAAKASSKSKKENSPATEKEVIAPTVRTKIKESVSDQKAASVAGTQSAKQPGQQITDGAQNSTKVEGPPLGDSSSELNHSIKKKRLTKKTSSKTSSKSPPGKTSAIEGSTPSEVEKEGGDEAVHKAAKTGDSVKISALANSSEGVTEQVDDQHPIKDIESPNGVPKVGRPRKGNKKSVGKINRRKIKTKDSIIQEDNVNTAPTAAKRKSTTSNTAVKKVNSANGDGEGTRLTQVAEEKVDQAGSHIDEEILLHDDNRKQKRGAKKKATALNAKRKELHPSEITPLGADAKAVGEQSSVSKTETEWGRRRRGAPDTTFRPEDVVEDERGTQQTHPKNAKGDGQSAKKRNVKDPTYRPNAEGEAAAADEEEEWREPTPAADSHLKQSSKWLNACNKTGSSATTRSKKKAKTKEELRRLSFEPLPPRPTPKLKYGPKATSTSPATPSYSPLTPPYSAARDERNNVTVPLRPDAAAWPGKKTAQQKKAKVQHRLPLSNRWKEGTPDKESGVRQKRSVSFEEIPNQKTPETSSSTRRRSSSTTFPSPRTSKMLKRRSLDSDPGQQNPAEEPFKGSSPSPPKRRRLSLPKSVKIGEQRRVQPNHPNGDDWIDDACKASTSQPELSPSPTFYWRIFSAMGIKAGRNSDAVFAEKKAINAAARAKALRDEKGDGKSSGEDKKGRARTQRGKGSQSGVRKKGKAKGKGKGKKRVETQVSIESVEVKREGENGIEVEQTVETRRSHALIDDDGGKDAEGGNATVEEEEEEEEEEAAEGKEEEEAEVPERKGWFDPLLSSLGFGKGDGGGPVSYL